jgi:hypothetical protein
MAAPAAAEGKIVLLTMVRGAFGRARHCPCADCQSGACRGDEAATTAPVAMVTAGGGAAGETAAAAGGRRQEKALRGNHARVFVAGFGNRGSDMLAYHAVGVPAGAALMINAQSRLAVSRVPGVAFGGFEDPALREWLAHRAGVWVAGVSDRDDDAVAGGIADKRAAWASYSSEVFPAVVAPPRPLLPVAAMGPPAMARAFSDSTSAAVAATAAGDGQLAPEERHRRDNLGSDKRTASGRSLLVDALTDDEYFKS